MALVENELVLLIQQFGVCADEVKVVFWCDVVHPPQLLQKLLAVLSHTEMHMDHMVHYRLAIFVRNLVILKRGNKIFESFEDKHLHNCGSNHKCGKCIIQGHCLQSYTCNWDGVGNEFELVVYYTPAT